MTDAVPADSGVSSSAESASVESANTDSAFVESLRANSSSAGETAAPPRHLWRRVFVWVFALLCGVLIPLLVQGEARAEWFTLAVGICVLITFGLQLGTAQREGFITRIATSIAGSVVIIAVAYAVALLVG